MMASPASGTPSIRELLHGSEEPEDPADTVPAAQHTGELTPRKFSSHMAPAAPYRAGSIPASSNPRLFSSKTEQNTNRAAGVSVQPLHYSPSRAQINTDFDSMDGPELTAYLENMGCSEETLAAVNTASFNGSHWLSIFQDEDSDNILTEELLINDRLLRLRLNSDASNQTRVEQQQAKTSTQTRPNNEKIPVPKLGMPQSGDQHLSYLQWDNYHKAITGWLQLGDHQLARLATSVYHDPSQDLDNLCMGMLSPLQQTVDGIWAVALMGNSYVASKHCGMDSKYTLNGHHSGLKLMATIGKVINKRTNRKQLDAMNLALNINPVQHPAELLDTLNELHLYFQIMTQQGTPPQDGFRYTLLMKLVEKLVEMPKLTLQLINPLSQVQKDHPLDADMLYKVLSEQAEEISNDPRFKKPTAKRPAPRVAAATKAESICPVYREGVRACPFGDRCNRQHSGRSGQVCDTEDYKLYGLCDDIAHCPHRHPWDADKFGDKQNALKRYRAMKAEGKQQLEQATGQHIVASVTPAAMSTMALLLEASSTIEDNSEGTLDPNQGTDTAQGAQQIPTVSATSSFVIATSPTTVHNMPAVTNQGMQQVPTTTDTSSLVMATSPTLTTCDPTTTGGGQTDSMDEDDDDDPWEVENIVGHDSDGPTTL